MQQQNVEPRVLVTNEHLWIAATYYSILTKSPHEMLYFLATIVFTGAAALVWSLRDGEAGNLMFDGASICEYPLIVLILIR